MSHAYASIIGPALNVMPENTENPIMPC